MIKVNKSNVHRFPTIFLFKGMVPLDKMEKFKFLESKQLFSNENLASNLIEYSTESNLTIFLKSVEFDDLLKDLSTEFKKRITIVEIAFDQNSNTDFSLHYFGSSLKPLTAQLFISSFGSRLDVTTEAIDETNGLTTIPPILKSSVSYCRLCISSNFFSNGNSRLSPKYSSQFSSKFTDVQVPFIVLPPLFAGIEGTA